MSKRTYGILAGLLGSAIGAWWYSRRRASNASMANRGTVIFDNTPTAAEGII